MNRIQQIQHCIDKAQKLESKLTEECFKIGGYTSSKIRHLLNNLGELGTEYLEIGVHRASTFVAAMYGNKMKGVAIDNWSEFNEDGTVKAEFLENIKQFGNSVEFIEADCFETELPQNKFDFYLYDGGHGYEEQKKAITQFAKNMQDEFILCVDDYNWEQVSQGTQDGIKEVGLKVLFEANLVYGYHNGFYVALLKK